MCSFCLERGLGKWTRHVSLGAVSWASICEQTLQSYWNLHVWNRKEALFLSSVSRYLGLIDRVHKRPGALCYVVLCIGTFMVSVVSGRTRLPLNVLRLPGSSSGASRSLPLAGQYPSGNHEFRRLLDRSENDNLWVL